MGIEQRSLKYVEYHMYETFKQTYLEKMQVHGLWNDSDGFQR